MCTPKCAEALSNLKIPLTSSPLLVCPEFMKWFVLETDASGAGLGAVLAQKQDDGSTCTPNSLCKQVPPTL